MSAAVFDLDALATEVARVTNGSRPVTALGNASEKRDWTALCRAIRPLIDQGWRATPITDWLIERKYVRRSDRLKVYHAVAREIRLNRKGPVMELRKLLETEVAPRLERSDDAELASKILELAEKL